MIYSICGTTLEWVQGKKKEILSILAQKRPSSPIEYITKEEQIYDVHTLLVSTGLFNDKSIIVIDIKENEKPVEDLLETILDESKESQHAVILVYSGEKKGYREILESFSQKTWQEEQVKEYAKKETSVFDFVESVCSKQRQHAWLLYTSTLKETEFELILGTLVWGFKTLSLSKSANEPTEVGIHPFLFKKYQSYAKKWEHEEIIKKLIEILSIVSCCREERFDEYLVLEKWILSI